MRNRLEMWRFAALAGFSLLYSFSSFSAIHGPLLATLPILQLARPSIRMLAVFHFALALLAGAGADKLLAALNRGDRRALGKLCRMWGAFVVAGGLLLVALTLVGILMPRILADGLQFRLSGLYYSWLMMLVALGLLLRRLAQRGRSRAFAILIIVALLVDLSPANTTAIIAKSAADPKTNYFPQSVYFAPELLKFVDKLKAEARWDDATSVLARNFQLVHRIRTTLGAGATAPAGYMDYYRMGGRTRDQLNVRYQFTSDAGGVPVMAERSSAIPRFQLTRSIRILPDNRFPAWLESADYRPDAVVVGAAERDKLPDDVVMLSRQTVPAEGAVKVLWENNRRIEMEVATLLPAFLLTSETYDPGWSAYVDKLETPVVKCNGVLRGIWLPAGQHRVSFRYLPAGLLQGFTVSLLYWLGLAAAVYLFRKR